MYISIYGQVKKQILKEKKNIYYFFSFFPDYDSLPRIVFYALLTDCMPVNSESLAVADLAFPGA